MLCRNLNIDVGAMTISSRRRFIAFVTSKLSFRYFPQSLLIISLVCGIIRGYASVKYNRFRVLNWAILTYYAEIIYILRSVLVRAYFPLARVVGPTVLSAIMIRILQQRLRQFVFRQGIAPIA